MTAGPGGQDAVALGQAIRDAFEKGGWAAGERLPSHAPWCFVCGEENPSGLGLHVFAADGHAVQATQQFDASHGGAPGVAHGGAVAAVLDDLFGFVLVRIMVPAVTRDLHVTYRLPTRLDVDTHLTASLVERRGRDLHLEASASQGGRQIVTATAHFVEVDFAHLSDPSARFGLQD